VRHLNRYIYIHICVHKHEYLCICTYIYINIRLYTIHIYIYTCIHYTYVYTGSWDVIKNELLATDRQRRSQLISKRAKNMSSQYLADLLAVMSGTFRRVIGISLQTIVDMRSALFDLNVGDIELEELILDTGPPHMFYIYICVYIYIYMIYIYIHIYLYTYIYVYM